MWAKHQPWHSQASDVPDTELEWNMWLNRLRPFAELEAGDEVVTVGRGGPKSGRLLWVVRVDEVVKGAYSSQDEAWQLIRTGMSPAGLAGFKKADFLKNDYTRGKSQAGWLLAFSSTIKHEIDIPRPDGFRIGQNGWAQIDPAYVR